jgi:ergothioneine biosynthesis protein EgtB
VSTPTQVVIKTARLRNDGGMVVAPCCSTRISKDAFVRRAANAQSCISNDSIDGAGQVAGSDAGLTSRYAGTERQLMLPVPQSTAVERVEIAERDEALAARFAAVRSYTRELAAPLSGEDAAAQSMPDASPAKWHLAHTTWFFETFVLKPYRAGYEAFHPRFEYLFNSYYRGIGELHPRHQRGLLTRPSVHEVMAYRAYVDRMLIDVLLRDSLPPAALDLLELGLHHEQQHQELLLTDIKHLFSQNPLMPEYRPQDLMAAEAPALHWNQHAGGIVEIGHNGRGFAFDNEGPRHRVLLQPYALASRVVTNAEYAAFVRDGGYGDARLWLSEGWAQKEAQRWQHPLYWSDALDAEFTLHGVHAIDPQRPVCHISFFEADAYARWAGARLPTEFEWEHAAGDQRISGQFADQPDGEIHPRIVTEHSSNALYGSVWCWTASPYVAYPGYKPDTGTVGEYNGKFMSNQWVLRGGSCASSRSHLRPTYRNFFPADARWQFSGLRLAQEL